MTNLDPAALRAQRLMEFVYAELPGTTSATRRYAMREIERILRESKTDEETAVLIQQLKQRENR